MAYVISIKRKNQTEIEAKINPEGWEYFGYDNYSGSFSSGYPIFTTHNYETFKSIEDAEKEFKENRKNILGNLEKYDFNTLGIRKIVYKTEKMLSMKEDNLENDKFRYPGEFKIGDIVQSDLFWRGTVIDIEIRNYPVDGKEDIFYIVNFEDRPGSIKGGTLSFSGDQLSLYNP